MKTLFYAFSATILFFLPISAYFMAQKSSLLGLFPLTAFFLMLATLITDN